MMQIVIELLKTITKSAMFNVYVGVNLLGTIEFCTENIHGVCCSTKYSQILPPMFRQ